MAKKSKFIGDYAVGTRLFVKVDLLNEELDGWREEQQAWFEKWRGKKVWGKVEAETKEKDATYYFRPDNCSFLLLNEEVKILRVVKVDDPPRYTVRGDDNEGWLVVCDGKSVDEIEPSSKMIALINAENMEHEQYAPSMMDISTDTKSSKIDLAFIHLANKMADIKIVLPNGETMLVQYRDESRSVTIEFGKDGKPMTKRVYTDNMTGDEDSTNHKTTEVVIM